MATIKLVLSYALYYSLYTGMAVCYVMLLYHFFARKQWMLALVSLFFIIPWCGETLTCYGGLLIALIIGWQEAGKWHIKKLMQIYTVLFLLTLPLAVGDLRRSFAEQRARSEAEAAAKAKKERIRKSRGASLRMHAPFEDGPYRAESLLALTPRRTS
jgi:hypothetical protein